MPDKNQKKSASGKKKGDGKSPSQKVKHDPQAESAREKFGLHGTSDGERHTYSS